MEVHEALIVESIASDDQTFITQVIIPTASILVLSRMSALFFAAHSWKSAYILDGKQKE